nr:putative F-box/kelch-repeat protein At1g12170 [Malus domestica]
MSTRKNVKGHRRDAQPLLMRASLTEEILFDILARLRVKSLLRFRGIYRSWNNLIISLSFINAHLKRNVVQNSCDHLLIHTDMSNCLSLFDAETFSKRLDFELPGHDFGFVVHSPCNGLFCISNSALMTLESPEHLWNPSIRKLKRLPNGLQHTTVFVHLGFGFHGEVDDYRVARVARFLCNKSIFGIEVYNLRLNCWRTITAVPPVSNDVNFLQSACVFLNGVVYWITKEPSQHSPSILTFDLGNEVFQKILLPETTVEVPTDVGIQVVENSISLFQVMTSSLACTGPQPWAMMYFRDV